MKSDQYLSLGTNIKTNRIKDPSVKPGTLKFLEENIGSRLQDRDVREDSLSKTPVARELRQTKKLLYREQSGE